MELGNYISEQLAMFVRAILLGASLGLVYDLFRTLRRLGGRVCAFYQYVLDQDPGPLRRWDRVYRCYDTLRDAKSRLLYRR